MDKKQAREHHTIALRLVVDGLEYIGIPPLKGRDHREPGWKEKQDYEDRMRSIIVRHFGRQRRMIREKLEVYAITHKAVSPIDLDDIYDDEDFIGELLALLKSVVKDGIGLFGKNSKLQIDWTLTNKKAFDWVQKYAFKLIKEIDDITRDLIRSAVGQFVETTGMTIGDVMDLLPFDEDRAQKIAVTEITRAYSTSNQMAGEDLKKEFPGVKIVKQWFTNNDDIVCVLCRPLDGKEIDIDDDFYTPESDYEDGNPPRHVNCRCWTETTTALGE